MASTITLEQDGCYGDLIVSIWSIIIYMSGSNRGSFLNLEEPKSSQKYEFEVAWAAAPHPAKAWKGGEDAIFVTPNVLVVADGVSAWSKVGIDAGIYARRLTA